MVRRNGWCGRLIRQSTAVVEIRVETADKIEAQILIVVVFPRKCKRTGRQLQLYCGPDETSAPSGKADLKAAGTSAALTRAVRRACTTLTMNCAGTTPGALSNCHWVTSRP